MAHNIALANGKHSVFTAGAAAWHKLGQNVADAQCWEEAMHLAGLDFEVRANLILKVFRLTRGESSVMTATPS